MDHAERPNNTAPAVFRRQQGGHDRHGFFLRATVRVNERAGGRTKTGAPNRIAHERDDCLVEFLQR